LLQCSDAVILLHPTLGVSKDPQVIPVKPASHGKLYLLASYTNKNPRQTMELCVVSIFHYQCKVLTVVHWRLQAVFRLQVCGLRARTGVKSPPTNRKNLNQCHLGTGGRLGKWPTISNSEETNRRLYCLGFFTTRASSALTGTL